MKHEHFKKFWEKNNFPTIEYSIVNSGKWTLQHLGSPSWAKTLIYRLQGQKMIIDNIWNYIPESAIYVAREPDGSWKYYTCETAPEIIEVRDSGYWTNYMYATIIPNELVKSLNFPDIDWKKSLLKWNEKSTVKWKENEETPLQFSNEVLDITQEECAELIQVISKIRRFGINNHNPYITPIKTNKQHLIEELGDVLAMVNIVKQVYDISTEELDLAIERKTEKLKKWTNIFKG